MYDQLARYYDLIHENLTADIPFVLQLAAEIGDPLLELGCGSGRLLLPLARAGHIITGLDNSPAMLERARQRLAAEATAARSRVQLIEGNMVTIKLPDHNGRYRLIFAGYNTFMHLTPSQTVTALRRIRDLLQPDGRLFLDLNNPFTLAETADTPILALENILRDPETGDVVIQLSAERLDAAGQRIQVTWVFDASPAPGGPVRRRVVEMDYFYHYPHELELLLSEAGLKFQSLLGDYDGSSFSEDSERLLLIGCQAT